MLAEVAAERAAQDARWGEQNHPDGPYLGCLGHRARACRQQQVVEAAAAGGRLAWEDILLEEVYEAVAECRAAGVPVFLKQLGSCASRHHRDLDNFPADLRVREYPTTSLGWRELDVWDAEDHLEHPEQLAGIGP